MVRTEVAKRIAEIEAALPFAILGFDTDNGGEFLNWHLLNYFTCRRRPVGFTRSRAYRKNDNARVEQKNWTHVRQLVGYGRLEHPQAAELLNELYAKQWGWFRNFFCPVMKHLSSDSYFSPFSDSYNSPLWRVIVPYFSVVVKSGVRLVHKRPAGRGCGSRSPVGAQLRRWR